METNSSSMLGSGDTRELTMIKDRSTSVPPSHREVLSSIASILKSVSQMAMEGVNQSSGEELAVVAPIDKSSSGVMLHCSSH